MLGPLFDDVQETFPGYVFELRQILMLYKLPIGTDDALPSIAKSLGEIPDIRLSVARILRGMIRREREQISSVELLAVLMQAAGHPPAAHADVREEAAIEELLGFMLEVRHPHQQSGASSRPALLRPGADTAEIADTPASVSREPQLQHVASQFEEIESEEAGLNRRVMLIVAACIVMVGLATMFALHPHGAAQQAITNARPDATLTATPERATSTARNSSILKHRGWFAEPSSDAEPAVRSASRPTSAALTSESNLSTRPAPVARMDAPHTTPAIQPVHLGTNPPLQQEIPAPIERAGTLPANRGIVPVDLRPTLVSYSRPDLRAQDRGYVHSASAGIMAGNLISNPSPVYPPSARSAGVQGEVTVRAVVDRDGSVTDARVVSGPPLLRDAALHAVEQWQYRPYLVDGKPSAIATTAIVDFKLPAQ